MALIAKLTFVKETRLKLYGAMAVLVRTNNNIGYSDRHRQWCLTEEQEGRETGDPLADLHDSLITFFAQYFTKAKRKLEEGSAACTLDAEAGDDPWDETDACQLIKEMLLLCNNRADYLLKTTVNRSLHPRIAKFYDDLLVALGVLLGKAELALDHSIVLLGGLKIVGTNVTSPMDTDEDDDGPS